MHKVLPEKKRNMQSSSSGGIGNGHVPFDDDVSTRSGGALLPPSHSWTFLVPGIANPRSL